MSIRSMLMAAGTTIVGLWVYDKFVKGKF